jgi:hypothetical protein
VSHGAYLNAYSYRDGTCFGNGVELRQHALGAITFERLKLGEVEIVKHNLPSKEVTRYRDCRIDGKIIVDEAANGGQNGGVILFESTDPANDLSRERFAIISRFSEIVVHNSNSSFTVT